VALLLLLANANVPVPKIRSISLSYDNAIDSRFSFQARLPGKSVEEVYLEPSTSQRVAFARSLGHALKELSGISVPCPGTLDPTDILDGSTSPQILHWS
jgi:hypothetical protein